MPITLDQANRIIDAILKRGAELDCRPISAVVVEPGCVVKAFQKEDGASMVRFEMAVGKAYAALVKAIQAADWNAAYQHLRTDEVRSPKPKASEMKEYFHDVGLNYPKSVTVTGGLIKGDRAHLDIMGTNYEDKKIRGVVVIRKFADNWRVLENDFFFEQ